jgi:hypothetical protein
MGRASSAKQDPSRREKIAGQRAAAQRQQTRNRLLIAGGAIIAVAAVVIAFVVIKANTPTSTSSSGSSNGPTGTALANLVKVSTSVPESTLTQVGAGSVSSKPMSITGSELKPDGKPEMLYMGAEYCPYCAAERWGMVVALSRFGTFSGLATVHSGIKNGSGTTEPYPGTPTWTFVNSKFRSDYVTFTPVEMNSNIPDSSTGGYTTLQAPTAAQQALLTKYDAPPYVSSSNSGAIPFVDFGNKYLIVGASYDPGVLTGLTWSQIATDLHDPSSKVAKAVNGTANYMTAALCKLTGDTPASACTATIKKLQGEI